MLLQEIELLPTLLKGKGKLNARFKVAVLLATVCRLFSSRVLADCCTAELSEYCNMCVCL